MNPRFIAKALCPPTPPPAWPEFWYDCYDYRVDPALLAQYEGVCYVYHIDRHWVRLVLKNDTTGTLRWSTDLKVDQPPTGALIAQLQGPVASYD